MKLEGDSLQLAKQLLPEIDWNAAGEEVTIDKVNELKSAALITRELHQKEVNNVFGKTIGPVENELKSLLGEEGKGKKVSEILPLLKEKITGFSTTIEELKSKAGEGKETLLKDLEQYKTLATSQEQKLKEYESKVVELEQSAQSKLEQLLLNHDLEKTFESAPWVDNVSPYAKKGLWLEITNEYQIKKEGEKKLVYDREGNIIQSGTGHLTFDELLQKKMKEGGLYKMNGATGNVPPQTGTAAPARNLPPEAAARMEAHQRKMEEHKAKLAGKI